MKALAVVLVLLCAHARADVDSIHANVFQIRSSRVVKVGDKESAARLIIARAKETDGWLLRQNPEHISLRIPQEGVNGFLAFIDSQGIVTDRSFARDDYTTEYIALVAKIQAKQSLLKQYIAVLDSSGTQGIYPVAREIADLQQSLEEAQGRVRGLEERMAYAQIDIYFRFRERRQPLSGGSSDFGWINSVDVRSLLENFRKH
jgi:hypothetical protein